MLKGAVRSRSQLPLVLLVYFVTPTVDVEPLVCCLLLLFEEDRDENHLIQVKW